MKTHTNPVAKAALLAALTLTLGTLPAQASRYWNDYTATGNLVDVSVLVQGHSAPLFVSGDAQGRFYFQAFKGRNYSLSIHNRSGERIGVLIAVDGLNVVNGARTGFTSGEPMYVLGPWETAVIRGWRTSLNEVRQFVFVNEQRSYAERTGQANGDMGWIRVMSFRENRPIAWDRRVKLYGDSRDEQSRLDQPAPAPSTENEQGTRPMAKREALGGEAGAKEQVAPGAPESFPGTGWGERRDDPVRRVQFNPQRYASDQLVLRYEYESGLRALGIFPDRRWRLREREQGQVGFAQPPRW